MNKNKQKVLVGLLLAIIIVTLGVLTVSILSQLGYLSEKINKQSEGIIVRTEGVEWCELFAGTWLSEYKECEGISERDCLSRGGYFNECASACRHNPGAEVCTMQCIPVCEYATLNLNSDLIQVKFPRPNLVVESDKLQILGRARGTWFFEGSFPVFMENNSGQRIIESFATAQGEWMTDQFVDFKAILDLTKIRKAGTVNLILKNDNPSGLTEMDKQIEIPLNIK